MKSYRLLVAFILSITLTHSLRADLVNYVTNGSFESAGGSFSGWTTTGSTSIDTISFSAPTDGSFKAFISNSSGSVAASVLSTFFGGAILPANGGGNAIEGSGIKQTFTAPGPAELYFDYRYVSQEDIHSGYDETFFFLDGDVTLLTDSDTAGVIPISGLPLRYKNGTAYRTVKVSLSAGTHTVGFGSYDTGDASGDSALILDNIQAIPEPATVMFGVGLGLAGLVTSTARRRRVRA